LHADVRAPAPILLATRSDDKAREIRAILGHRLRTPLVSLRDIGLEPAPEEDDIEAFDTFLANAHAKADYFMHVTGLATIADDSGISVDALDGAPGVRSRRFATTTDPHGSAQDRANNEKLLRELDGVPHERRTAHYTCAAVLHSPDGRRIAAIGTCSGIILRKPRGTRGFGYDPLFLDPASNLSFAEMTHTRKNQLSHRGRAFNALAATQ
jgi:XTP/dITP diphosphohydrolase